MLPTETTTPDADPVPPPADEQAPPPPVVADGPPPPDSHDATVAPVPDDEAPPIAPTLLEEWAAQRQAIVVLLAQERFSEAAFNELATAYEASVQAGGAAEWERLRAAWEAQRAVQQTAAAQTWDEAHAERQTKQATYDALFTGCTPLELGIATQLQGLTDASVGAVPTELRDPLLNHKKGLEIIQRMLRRVYERRKPAPDASASNTPPELVAPLTTTATEALRTLSQQMQEWQRTHQHQLRAAQQAAQQLHNDTLQTLKTLLGVFDGIDAGRSNETDLLNRLQAFRPEQDALLAQWGGIYAALTPVLDDALRASGIQSFTPPLGTMFDPDTMEPLGTVRDPSRRNEEVAVVVRRGYVFGGQTFRPSLVEVVMNTPATEE